MLTHALLFFISDIYEEYFSELDSDEIVDEPSAKTINVFRNPWSAETLPGEKKHTATGISWFPGEMKNQTDFIKFVSKSSLPY